jgi:hypothetical protein
MANMSVPVDGRMQFPMATVMVANASLNRPLLSGVEPVGYGSGLYLLKNSWPPAKASGGGSSFSGLASQAVPEVAAPRSSAGALALWPNLK